MTEFGEEQGAETGIGTHLQRLATISGAAVSLGLVCGMGYWGYTLLVRDVQGVPVVQAMEGAFRIAPDEPGGTEAPYQGLAVNEVAAVGTAGGQVDEVTLAPPPVDLADEDAPLPALVDDAAPAGPSAPEPSDDGTMMVGIDPAAVPNDPDVADADLAPPEAPADPDPSRRAEAPSEEVEDRPEDAKAIDLAVAEALSGIGGLVESDASAGTSQRPSPRPAPMQTASATMSDGETRAIPAVMRAEEVDVASLDTGTRLVQLGAFTDEADARAEWAEISARFEGEFDGKRRIVQEAVSGGKTFYRLRAEGFADLADARRFCTTLLAGAADCIPVEVR